MREKSGSVIHVFLNTKLRHSVILLLLVWQILALSWSWVVISVELGSCQTARLDLVLCGNEFFHDLSWTRSMSRRFGQTLPNYICNLDEVGRWQQLQTYK